MSMESMESSDGSGMSMESSDDSKYISMEFNQTQDESSMSDDDDQLPSGTGDDYMGWSDDEYNETSSTGFEYPTEECELREDEVFTECLIFVFTDDLDDAFFPPSCDETCAEVFFDFDTDCLSGLVSDDLDDLREACNTLRDVSDYYPENSDCAERADDVFDACGAVEAFHYPPTLECFAECSQGYVQFHDDCLQDLPTTLALTGDYPQQFYANCQDNQPQPPDTPDAPDVSVRVDGSINVRWTLPDSNIPITGFTCYYQKVNDTEWEEKVFSGEYLSFIIEPNTLDPNQVYEFKVTATNAMGTSDESETSSIETPGLPPSAPQDVEIVLVNDTMLDIQWAEPAELNGATSLWYIVVFYIVELGFAVEEYTNTTNLQVEVYPGTSYTISVLALTQDDLLGNFSDPQQIDVPNVAFGQLDVPELVAVTSDTVYLSWYYDPLSYSATNFTITVTPPAPAEPYEETTMDLFIEIGGLTHATLYSFTIRGNTPWEAEGVNSDAIQVLTEPIGPSAPSAPTISGSSSSSFTVSWSAPSDNGGSPVVGYMVQVVGQHTHRFFTSGESMVVVKQNLVDDSAGSFVVSVAARNNVDISDLSSSVDVSFLFPGPEIESVVAMDLEPVEAGFTVGDHIEITFGEDTNQPDIVGHLSFLPPQSNTYTADWQDLLTVRLTFDSADQYIPIGITLVSVLDTADLQSSAGSEPSTSSAPLTGDWGVEQIYDYLDLVGLVEIDEDDTYSLSDGVAFLGDFAAAADSFSVELSVPEAAGTLSVSVLAGTPSDITSALAQATYQPPSNWSGQTVISVVVTQGDTLENGGTVRDTGLLRVLVSGVNDEPAVDAPDSIALVPGENTAWSITLSDADVEYAPLRNLRVFVMTQAARFTFSSVVDGVDYFPADTTTGTTGFSLTGPLDALNSALSNLQVQADSPDMDGDQLTVYFSDAANGGEPVMEAEATTTIEVSCPTTPPEFVSAQFGDSGGNILVTLDQPVYQDTAITECSDFFNDIAALGADPYCFFISDDSVWIVLGRGAQILPGGSLTPTPGAFRVCLGSAISASTSTTVVAPANPPVPTVQIFGVLSATVCDGIDLYSIASNLGGREAQSYQWAASDNLLTGQTNVRTDRSSFSIGGDLLTAGTTYTISLTVTNSWGQRSETAFVPVSISALPVPTVSIAGSSVRSVRKSAASMDLIATAVASACLSESDKRLFYSWTVSPSLNLSTTDSPFLRVPIDDMQAGQTYSFSVVAGMAKNTELNSTAAVSVEVESSPLEVVILGGTLQTVSVSAPLSFAGYVYDPDASADAQTSMWTCKSSSGGACVNANTGSALALPTTLEFQALAGSLGVGIYELGLSVTKGSRQSSSSIYVSIQPGAAPTVKVFRTNQGKLKSSSKLSRSSAVVAPDPSPYTYQWSVVEGTVALPADTTSSTLTINAEKIEDVWSGGQAYTFRLTVTQIQGGEEVTSSSDVTVQVNSAPSQGTLQREGSDDLYELQTPLTLVAPGWEDADEPLRYQFFLKEDGDKVPLSVPQESNRFPIKYLPGSSKNDNSVQVGVVVTDSLGASTNSVLTVYVLPKAINSTFMANALAEAQATAANTQDAQALVAAVGSLTSSLNREGGDVQVADSTNLKKDMVDLLSNNAESLPSEVVIGPLTSLTENPESVDVALGTSSYELTKKLSKQAKQNKGKVPFDKAFKVTKNINDARRTVTGRRLLAAANDAEQKTRTEAQFTTYSELLRSLSSEELDLPGEVLTPLTETSLAAIIARGTADSDIELSQQGQTVTIKSLDQLGSETYVDGSFVLVDPNPFTYEAATEKHEILSPSFTVDISDKDGQSFAALQNLTLPTCVATVTISYSDATCTRGLEVGGKVCSPTCAMWDWDSDVWVTDAVSSEYPDSNDVSCCLAKTGTVAVVSIWAEVVEEDDDAASSTATDPASSGTGGGGPLSNAAPGGARFGGGQRRWT
jgi:hypothetical protein